MCICIRKCMNVHIIYICTSILSPCLDFWRLPCLALEDMYKCLDLGLLYQLVLYYMVYDTIIGWYWYGIWYRDSEP